MPAILGAGAADDVTVEQHRADTLAFDERVQRAVNQARVRKIAKSLNVAAIGVITVSRRDDGSLTVLDGQHRLLALLENGLGATVVTCHVHHGLGVAGEAELFLLLNNTQGVNPVDSYRIGLTAGDEECVAINKIVEAVDLRVAMQVGPGVISCVATMRTVYRKGGPNALAPALCVPLAAWGNEPTSVEGPIVAGLGEVFHRYGEEIDRAALVRKLSKFPGGAPALLGKAKGLHEYRKSVTRGRCVASLILDLYNRGRRTALAPL